LKDRIWPPADPERFPSPPAPNSLCLNRVCKTKLETVKVRPNRNITTVCAYKPQGFAVSVQSLATKSASKVLPKAGFKREVFGSQSFYVKVQMLKKGLRYLKVASASSVL
jgi:hypothetical protein